VLKAGTNDARFLKDEKVVEIAGRQLFQNQEELILDGFDPFEIYPNRNSLPYIDIYGIPETATMIRGTIRNTGWCAKLFALAQLGLVADTDVDLPADATFLDLMGHVCQAGGAENVIEKVASFLGEAPDSDTMAGFKWLGLFEDRPLPVSRNILDIMTATFLEKMPYKKGERDMIILHHDFEAQFPDNKKRICSTLVEYGVKDGDSGMARTVGLPAAIGAELILNGKIDLPGVHIPDTPAIYDPVLDRLSELGIRFRETQTLL